MSRGLKEFKKAVCVGYCLSQFKDKISGATYEKWQTEKGVILIEETESGWEAYKASPFVGVKETIEFIKQ